MNLRNLTAATLAVGSLTLIGGAAHAQLTALGAGGVVSPVNIVDGPFANSTFVTQRTSSFTASTAQGTITGNILSSVYSSTSGPFGTVATPTLDFFYQLVVTTATNGQGNPAGIDSVSLASFAPGGTVVAIQVGQDTNGGVVGQTAQAASISSASRNGGGGGVTISFSGANGQAGGTTSSIFAVRTASTGFSDTGSAGILGNNGIGTSTTATLLAPGSSVTAAPEPGSIALLGVGFAGMVGMIARRKKA